MCVCSFSPPLSSLSLSLALSLALSLSLACSNSLMSQGTWLINKPKPLRPLRRQGRHRHWQTAIGQRVGHLI